MSEQIQKFRHIVVSENTYEIIKRYGKYGDTMDTILGRILVVAAEQRRKGEQLVIS